MYGETSFELVAEVIKHAHIKESDVFLDLGSGRCCVCVCVCVCAFAQRTCKRVLVDPFCQCSYLFFCETHANSVPSFFAPLLYTATNHAQC